MRSGMWGGVFWDYEDQFGEIRHEGEEICKEYRETFRWTILFVIVVTSGAELKFQSSSEGHVSNRSFWFHGIKFSDLKNL
jgi:hypothetical protein